MKIENKNIAELTPYKNNPRRNDEAVEYVANSIKEFGFKVPIIIDRDGVIIAGHTRVKAAEQLGLESVPCVIADDLTEDQTKAFRLADNKTAEFAEWNFDLLDIELADISNIDMASFGFFDIKNDAHIEPEIQIVDSYSLVVECENENELESLYERLQREGYQCRISV